MSRPERIATIAARYLAQLRTRQENAMTDAYGHYDAADFGLHVSADQPGNVPEHVFRTIAVAADIDPQDTIDNPQFRMIVEAAYIHGRAASQRPKPGDRVEDGGVMGTLVRCPERGGGGLLHNPDELPETATPKP